MSYLVLIFTVIFTVFFDDRNITAIKNTVVPPMEAKINAHGNPIC